MKRMIKFLVYPLAINLMSLFIIVGCSDDIDPIDSQHIQTRITFNVRTSSAQSGGYITDPNASEVTERGIVWSTQENPSLNDHLGMTNDGEGLGIYQSEITGLSPETTYYVRAYATNKGGTSYGQQRIFTTYSTNDLHDIEGNYYRTILVGDQEWMAENLRVARYNNGDSIPAIISNEDWANTTEGAYAIYPHEGGFDEDDVEDINSDEEMVAAYGKLYNWYAVDDKRGLCPKGWQIPSYDQWRNFIGYIIDLGHENESDEPENTFSVLISCRQVNSILGGDCDTSEHPRWNKNTENNYNYPGIDKFGFAGLPAGARNWLGGYGVLGGAAYSWLSSDWPDQENMAFGTLLNSSNGLIINLIADKNHGYSVRCVKTIE